MTYRPERPTITARTLRDALRGCAARDRYHTPKNLVVALSVGPPNSSNAFQWATPGKRRLSEAKRAGSPTRSPTC